jgi:vitamin B12 transporter
MRTHFQLLLTLASVTAIGTPAFATTPVAPDTELTDDNAILVTALREPIRLDRVASSLTVLDTAAIDRGQAPAVSDLLVRTPGISFTRNGGYGTSTSIRIRGAEADQTVVVIDGVKLADPSSTGGGYNFANLLTGDAGRIEILRGPQSILWGSQAIGGVVNIVTTAPTKPLEGSVSIEGGSRDTPNARAALGGTSGRIDWRIAGNGFHTDGISAISPRYGGVEKDGAYNYGGTGQLDYRLAEGVSLDVRGYYSRSKVGIDSTGTVPDSPEYSRNREWLGYVGLNADLFGGVFHNRVSFSNTDTARLNINPARTINTLTFDACGRARRYEYQGSVDIARGWDVLFGAEREEQRMRTASPPNSTAPYVTTHGSAAIDSFYTKITGTVVEGLTLSAGARQDHHSSFGNSTVLSAGGVWALFDGKTMLRASYGEGLKAPTLYQLFSDFGNTALAPEKAHGWDAGIEQHLFDRHILVSATWFERTTTNLIVFSGCPTTNRPPLCFTPGTTAARSGYYANVQLSHAHGIELAAAANVAGLSLDGNYTWMSAEDKSPGVNFGNQLARRPRNAANASATYAWPFGLSTGVAVRYSGKAFDTAQTSATTLPFVNEAYTLIDLRVEMPVTRAITAFGRVENITDKYYETARRYGQLGRSFYAGFRGRF